MELFATLSKIDNLNKLCNSGVDGIIFGSVLSARFNYDYGEFMQINNACLENKVKRYISLDALIEQNDRPTLYNFLEFLKKIEPDGIYFADLGVINVAKSLGLNCELIYDPGTLITNSLDASFYVKQGIGVVLSRELTVEETVQILKNNINQIDMQIFGHLRMSYSKRTFLSNYFKHINKEVNIKNCKDITLREENRDYAFPIVENAYGTRIYSDYVFFMYKELAYLKYVLKRMIIDDDFIKDDNLVFSVIRDVKRLNKDNVDFLVNNLITSYPDIKFSSGYLYKKTSKVKEDE